MANTPAPIETVCEHSERCGGCPLIGLPYAEQLTQKRGRVVASLGRYASLELVYTDPVLGAEPVTGYRTRAKLIVGSGARVGLYARGGHDVVDIPRCRVLSPRIASVADSLRAMIRAHEREGGPLAPADGKAGGALRAVDLREIDGGEGQKAGVLVTFVVQREPSPPHDALREAALALAKENPSVLGVAMNVHAGDSPQVLGAQTTHLHGVEAAFDRVGESMHLATFGSFVQAHRGQAGRVHALVGEAVTQGKPAGRAPRVLDLYGGSGAIALSLAARGAEVHLVEAFAPAAAQASKAALEQKLTVTATAGDVTTTLRRAAEREERYECVVVNPPRRGTSPAARELLGRLGSPTLVYVSCDPDTLARDLDHLSRLGYLASSLKPLDMIPMTEEVETIAVMRRGPVPRPLVLYDDRELTIVVKSPHEPTTPQGEYASSLFQRVRGLASCEEAVPVHKLDVGTSGVTLFVKSGDLLAKWQAALDAASSRKIYLAAVRGITPVKGSITRDLREDGKVYPARTRYRRLAVFSGHSVLRVVPEQGRTHQIRRHLAAINHPLLGDERYGHAPTNRFFEEKHTLDRTFLHCVRVELEHPDTRVKLVVEAPLPGDLRTVVERASGNATLRFLDHKNALGERGASSIPPPPDSSARAGSAPDLDLSRSSLHPEPVGTRDEDD